MHQFRLSVRVVWVTNAFEAPTLLPAGAVKVGRHVRSLAPLHRFRQSVNDIWVTRAFEAPTLLPAGAMSVGGHVRSLAPLHRFRQSVNDIWVTRAFEAPTRLKRACDPVAPSRSYVSGRTRALSNLIAPLSSDRE